MRRFIFERNNTTLFCDLAGARTQDPNIKSVVLYLLSYQVQKEAPVFNQIN